MINREQALALPGIGKALADKIMEMLENGRIRKVVKVFTSEKVKVFPPQESGRGVQQ